MRKGKYATCFNSSFSSKPRARADTRSGFARPRLENTHLPIEPCRGQVTQVLISPALQFSPPEQTVISSAGWCCAQESRRDKPLHLVKYVQRDQLAMRLRNAILSSLLLAPRLLPEFSFCT